MSAVIMSTAMLQAMAVPGRWGPGPAAEGFKDK